MPDYASLKAANAESRRCVRAGCTNECQDDHLLCEQHGADHRERNRRHMRIVRRYKRAQMRLWR